MCFLSQVIVCIIVYQCVPEMQNRATESHIKFLPSAVLHPLPAVEFHIVITKTSWAVEQYCPNLNSFKNKKILVALMTTNLKGKVISLKDSKTCIFYFNFLLLFISLCSGTAENLKCI